MIDASFPEPNSTSVKKEVGRLGSLEARRLKAQSSAEGSKKVQQRLRNCKETIDQSSMLKAERNGFDCIILILDRINWIIRIFLFPLEERRERKKVQGARLKA